MTTSINEKEYLTKYNIHLSYKKSKLRIEQNCISLRNIINQKPSAMIISMTRT